MSAPAHARIAYRRRASPLHAARATVVGAYCAAIALAALLTEHPLLLGSLLATVLAAGAAAGNGPQLLRPCAVPRCRCSSSAWASTCSSAARA